MEDAEDSHFDAEEEGGDTDFDVRVGDAGRWFYGAGRGEEGDDDLMLMLDGFQKKQRRLTVCQNERKMTSLMAVTFSSGWCSAKSFLSWM